MHYTAMSGAVYSIVDLMDVWDIKYAFSKLQNWSGSMYGIRLC